MTETSEHCSPKPVKLPRTIFGGRPIGRDSKPVDDTYPSGRMTQSEGPSSRHKPELSPDRRTATLAERKKTLEEDHQKMRSLWGPDAQE